ncbi:MAG: hypothetical protein RR842_04090 [Gordonibacter sp.]|uniref:hypothetical protein n=1 Tax=Gordonibacter sp. TaxID=1968902 RepID=UPI002FC8BA66
MSYGLVDYDPSFAWDLFCEEKDRKLSALVRENPGCGTCNNGVVCPCGNHVWCSNLGDFSAISEPECDYDFWENKR